MQNGDMNFLTLHERFKNKNLLINKLLLYLLLINKLLLRYLHKSFEPFQGDMKKVRLTFFAFFYFLPALHVNSRNAKTICEICSEVTIKAPEWRRWYHRSGVFIVNFEQVLLICLVFPLLTLNKWMPTGLGLEIANYHLCF